MADPRCRDRSTGYAQLVLRIPKTHVQEAVRRLTTLGTIIGENVEVLEKRARIGGLSGSIVEDGFTFDAAGPQCRIFADYATGAVTTRQIADRLQAEQPKGQKVAGSRKGKWTADRVAALLTSDAYRASFQAR